MEYIGGINPFTNLLRTSWDIQVRLRCDPCWILVPYVQRQEFDLDVYMLLIHVLIYMVHPQLSVTIFHSANGQPRLGITCLVGKYKFKLFLHRPLAE